MSDRFQMLYCDSTFCRVNTFERGDSDRGGRTGLCPGCNSEGIPVE